MRRKGSITKRCMVYIMSAMMMISPISASVAFPVWGYANEVDPDGDQNPPAEPQEASIGEDTPIAPAESQSGEGTGENNDQVINNETVAVNNDTIDINNGTVETNNGTVETNNETVETNNGEVETNNGTVTDNHGTVVNGETGVVTNNYFDGTVTNETVTNNYGGTVTGAMVANQFWRVTCDIPADTTYVNGFVNNDTDNYIQVTSNGETQAVNASIKLTPNTNNVINAQNLNSTLDGEYNGTAFTYSMAKDGNDIIVTILSLEGNICLTDSNLQLVIEENTTTHTVTYKVLNGKWNDGTTADKEEQVIDQGNLMNIPDVGSNPSSGYKAGSWSQPAPNSDAKITENVIYTYTYAQDEPTPPSPIVYNVTVTTDGHGEAYANHRSGVTGTRVMLKEVSDDKYGFKQWEVISGGVELDNYRDYTTSFTIKNADVEIKAHFEKKEEHTRENDVREELNYGVDNSKSEASWTPAQATQTIAVQKDEKQQAAGTQLAAVQTLLRTFATKPAGPGEAPKVINLDMTKVDILDPATVNLLVLNNKFEFNIKISDAGGQTIIVKIPANFNFRRFIKADGTINIHEVLWSIILSRK
ncbi:MAG: hypothetical protein K5921_06550 [Lachnospiraceae bacterium]|nr:hypothetical protein [Lachnospiraceae bacterium]